MMASTKPGCPHETTTLHALRQPDADTPFMKARAVILLLRLFALLPLGLARRIGSLLGLLCWLAKRRMAKTTLINLRLCYPALDEQALHALARNSLQQTFQTMLEAGMAWLWPAEKALARVVAVDGLHLLRAAHAKGKGVLVLAPHLGNWEILGLYLNASGCGQTHQLYQPPDDRALDALVYRARSRAGANMVATDPKGVARLLQALRQGEIVGILPDQVPPASGGEFAPFFGVPALTMTLFNKLQQRTQASVVLGYARRTSRPAPGFEIVFTVPPDEIYAEHMPTALAAMNKAVEHLIAEAPEQYQWEYKRFKRQPAGKPAPY